MISSTFSGGYWAARSAEPFVALRPLVDELLVHEVVADEDVDEPEGQRAVGAGPQLQVDVGEPHDGGRDARVDDDELAARSFWSMSFAWRSL